jgi:hypothetical protein
MPRGPQLDAAVDRLGAEPSASAKVAGKRIEQVARPVALRLAGLLGVVAGAGEVPVAEGGRQPLSGDRDDGRAADEELPPPLPGRQPNSPTSERAGRCPPHAGRGARDDHDLRLRHAITLARAERDRAGVTRGPGARGPFVRWSG